MDETQHPQSQVVDIEEPVSQHDEGQDPKSQPDESQQPFSQVDESQQPFSQVDESQQPFSQVDESQQPFSQVDESQQPFSQVDDNQQPFSQVDDSQQPFSQPKMQEHGETEAEDDEDTEVVEEDSGFEKSEDEVAVDGATVEGCLKGKGKKPYSDDEPVSAADSDYNDEENINLHHESPSEDEDKGGSVWKKVLPKFQEFRQDTDMGCPQLKLGLVFPSGSVFKDAIR